MAPESKPAETGLRSTAPQSEYTVRHVGIGFALFLLGLVIAFVLPVVLVSV